MFGIVGEAGASDDIIGPVKAQLLKQDAARNWENQEFLAAAADYSSAAFPYWEEGKEIANRFLIERSCMAEARMTEGCPGYQDCEEALNDCVPTHRRTKTGLTHLWRAVEYMNKAAQALGRYVGFHCDTIEPEKAAYYYDIAVELERVALYILMDMAATGGELDGISATVRADHIKFKIQMYSELAAGLRQNK